MISINTHSNQRTQFKILEAADLIRFSFFEKTFVNVIIYNYNVLKNPSNETAFPDE